MRADPVGLGIILGDPTGLSAKFRFDDSHALQLHLGFGITGDDGGRVTGVVDYLFHFDGYPVERAGELVPLLGLGGKLIIREGRDPVTLGLRVPVGLAFFIHRFPIEVAVEVAVGIHLLPATSILVDGGLIGRWYF